MLTPAILRPAKAPWRAQRLLYQAAASLLRMKNTASMSLSKSLCAQFEHSIARI